MILFRARGVNAQKNFTSASCSGFGLPLGSRLHEVAAMQTTNQAEFVPEIRSSEGGGSE
jgi:hypothetical protein